MTPPVRATYRVQLTPSFDLDAAAGIVPYLAELGISHVYTSPLAEATPGSAHGYDVTDHTRVRGELGGPEALRRLWEALAEHGMGQVVDLVPNHMGIRSPRNRWWWDVLRAGPSSRYAAYFDIDCRSSVRPSPRSSPTGRSPSSPTTRPPGGPTTRSPDGWSSSTTGTAGR